MFTLTADASTRIRERGVRNESGKMVVQYKHDTTNMSIYGSLDGSEYCLIETFSASVIKEVTYVPFIAFTKLTTAGIVTSATIAAANSAGVTHGTLKLDLCV